MCCPMPSNTLGKISINPCEGIKTLYRGADRSELVWTSTDIERLKASAPELTHAIDLAAHTGLRLSDLVSLSWSHIGEDEIVIATSKSRGRRNARVPLYDDLRAVLARIPKRSTAVLTHSQGRPWSREEPRECVHEGKERGGFPQTFTFTICAARRRPSFIWRGCPNV